MSRPLANAKHFFAAITGNLISLIGTVLMLGSLTLISMLLIMQSMGFSGGAYLGIITFVVLPVAFVLGTILVPIGILRHRRKQKKLSLQEAMKPGNLPVIDLNNENTRSLLLGFTLLALPIIALLTGMSYKAVHYMDSTEFCGTACHQVMQPEYTAFQRTAHARVGCAGCHIGTGADWFVKSKLSGSWQLVAVALDLYPRPIPTPVHSLRPANGTCEQCHWPTKFVGDRLKVRTHFADDETNTEMKTALMVKVGGKEGDSSHGIHWHIDPNHQIRYLSDPSRTHIYDVELTDKTENTVKVFKSKKTVPDNAEWRTMDCVDCHNRPSHTFNSPEDEVDMALLEGRIDKSLPYIKREGVRILTEKEYPTHEEARMAILTAVEAFYQQNYPELADSEAVAAAGKALGDAYTWNNFPHMNVTWNMYPNHIGHQQAPGCFRCHDNKHKTENGEKISKKCSTCHNIVAKKATDSDILKKLGL